MYSLKQLFDVPISEVYKHVVLGRSKRSIKRLRGTFRNERWSARYRRKLQLFERYEYDELFNHWW
jgi:hypothetical protein